MINPIKKQPVDTEVTAVKVISTIRNLSVEEYTMPDEVSGSKFIGKLRALLGNDGADTSASGKQRKRERKEAQAYGEDSEASTHSHTVSNTPVEFTPEVLGEISRMDSLLESMDNSDLSTQVREFKKVASEAVANARNKGYAEGSPAFREELSKALSNLPPIRVWSHQLQATLRNKVNTDGSRLNKADGLYYQSERSRTIYTSTLLDISPFTSEVLLVAPAAQQDSK